MRICFTLDDVLRDKTGQILKMYKKYVKHDLDIDSVEITKEGMAHDLGIENPSDYNDFLYKDYPFEVFAEANPPVKGVDKTFIMWHLNLDDDVEISISNPMEFNNSIGYSYFYLSKIATRVRNVFFPKDSNEIWDKCDILVTADRKLLNTKPEGKIAIKIEMPYNEDCEADYTYKDLSQFLDDKELTDVITGKDE